VHRKVARQYPRRSPERPSDVLEEVHLAAAGSLPLPSPSVAPDLLDYEYVLARGDAIEVWRDSG